MILLEEEEVWVGQDFSGLQEGGSLDSLRQ